MKCKANTHEKLNTAVWFIRNKELSLSMPEKIKTDLGKQRVMNYKRIIIRRGGKEIQTHSYILTFNKSIIPNEVKIKYCHAKVENISPHP